MARIRSIKPEFFTSEQVVECSTNARLLFVGMWCFCDDGGVHPASVKRLKMEVFPGDGMTDSNVQKLIDELLAAGLLIAFESEGKQWWAVTGWHHQKIDRPNFRYPSPPDRRTLDDDSTNDQREIDEQSPPEGKGVDRESIGSGVEGKGDPPNPPAGGMEKVPSVSDPEFDEFADAYPKINGVAIGVEMCRSLFARHSPDERKRIIGAARRYKQVCKDGRIPKDAHKFFTHHRATDGPYWRQFAESTNGRTKKQWGAK